MKNFEKNKISKYVSWTSKTSYSGECKKILESSSDHWTRKFKLFVGVDGSQIEDDNYVASFNLETKSKQWFNSIPFD